MWSPLKSLFESFIDRLLSFDKYWESEEIYYSDHRPEISGGNESHIQFPDIDIIGESEEVAPIGASSGNHLLARTVCVVLFLLANRCLFFFDIRILITFLVSSNSSCSLLWVTLSITSSMWCPLKSLFELIRSLSLLKNDNTRNRTNRHYIV
jgi:hypothetical protein